ncbi:hypothetical protein ELY21_08115 [Legionella sp. km535]|uniref:hypothetical protein n=1 Tax=Legionella sp. km535 TaxID=2498107 RepID=UPI000F8CEC6C|nr:hypothetical protein [Legionella sp. km535]RUR18414.1 hypothetical protein ELY21_08115 [Legionella sp. km535]
MMSPEDVPGFLYHFDKYDFNGRILTGSYNLAGDSSLRSERRHIFNGTDVARQFWTSHQFFLKK